jgi:hypothetical protein
VGLRRGTGATSNENYTTVFTTYLYTVKVFSMSDLSSLYWVMILPHYAVTNITPLAARIQPAPRYLAPMRHIRGKSVQRLRPCVRLIFPLKKKAEAFSWNRSPSHCLATPSTSQCLSRTPPYFRSSSFCVRDSSPRNPIVRWQRASPASRLPTECTTRCVEPAS